MQSAPSHPVRTQPVIATRLVNTPRATQGRTLRSPNTNAATIAAGAITIIRRHIPARRHLAASGFEP